MYYVNYHTGAGNETIDGTLEEAMKLADEGACYTQQNITIEDESGTVVALREWWGCMDGIEEMQDPIKFGSFGFYGDWETF